MHGECVKLASYFLLIDLVVVQAQIKDLESECWFSRQKASPHPTTNRDEKLRNTIFLPLIWEQNGFFFCISRYTSEISVCNEILPTVSRRVRWQQQQFFLDERNCKHACVWWYVYIYLTWCVYEFVCTRATAML